MRNPNGYGSVIKLGGKRRKPWAVRVATELAYNPKTDSNVVKYKYVGYSDTRKGAMQILAEYNAGMPIKDNISRTKSPTFEEIWNCYSAIKFDQEKPNPVSAATIRNYTIAYNRFSEIHNKKMANVTAPELQVILDQYKDKSLSTVGTMKSVVNQMCKYAKKYYDIEDISKTLEIEYTASTEEMHHPFTQDEINLLWEHESDYQAQFILMMIYSGVRPQEFVKIKTENVHLDEDYFIGGMKTSSGTNRIIPIHSRVKKFYESNLHPEKEYLINKTNFRELTSRDKTDNYSYALFTNTIWNPYVKKIGIDHKPHDPRHTFATLMSNAGANLAIIKMIMGHKQSDENGKIDVTNSVYIHKTIDQLKEEVEKI